MPLHSGLFHYHLNITKGLEQETFSLIILDHLWKFDMAILLLILIKIGIQDIYMNFLEQIKTENNTFISCLKGSLILIFFHILGQVPLSIYIISHSNIINNYASQHELLSTLPSNMTLFLILLPFAATIPFIYLVVTKLHERSFLSLINSRNRVDYKRIIFSFLLWGTISALMIFFDFIISPENYVWNFKFNSTLVWHSFIFR